MAATPSCDQSAGLAPTPAAPAQEQQESAALETQASASASHIAAPDQIQAGNSAKPRQPGGSSLLRTASGVEAQAPKASPDNPSLQADGDSPAGQSAMQAASRGSAPEIGAAQSNLNLQQPSGPGIESAALARGAEAAPSLNGAASSHSGSAAAPHSTQETFTALDAGSAVGKPGWIHADAQHAEAGFQDPDLGWVSVRANLNGGGVHAALTADSADAAQVLGGHLAGLSTFLTEQHTPVATLTLGDSAAGGAGNPADQNQQQGEQQGAGQNADQRALPGSQSDSFNAPGLLNQSIAAASGEFEPVAWLGNGRGEHISVMA
jgi:hypothetical protein